MAVAAAAAARVVAADLEDLREIRDLSIKTGGLSHPQFALPLIDVNCTSPFPPPA
jgi:hypothetical protein